MDCQNITCIILFMIFVTAGLTLCSIDVFPSDCGKVKAKRRGGKIVNGKEAYKGQFPWMALIGFKQEYEAYQSESAESMVYFCGGSVITDTVILTAGHCLAGLEEILQMKGSILLGHHESNDAGEHEQHLQIHSTKVHKYFVNNGKPSDYDFALIFVVEKIIFTDYVIPICLPLTSHTLTIHQGRPTLLSGWGSLGNSKGAMSQHLMYTEATYIHQSECGLRDTEAIICVIGKNTSGTCPGDSGGPMVVFDDVEDQFVQLGVTSFVQTLVNAEDEVYCDPSKPSYFADVRVVLAWIRRSILNFQGVEYTE